MSGLSNGVQALLGRDLTLDENDKLTKFQQIYQINDDDPLVVVLSMLGMNKILIESIPETLRQSSEKAVEVHAQTLRDQSNLIAKELILTVAQNIHDAARAQSTWRDRLVEYALVGLVGGLVGGGIAWAMAKMVYHVAAKAAS